MLLLYWWTTVQWDVLEWRHQQYWRQSRVSKLHSWLLHECAGNISSLRFVSVWILQWHCGRHELLSLCSRVVLQQQHRFQCLHWLFAGILFQLDRIQQLYRVLAGLLLKLVGG